MTSLVTKRLQEVVAKHRTTDPFKIAEQMNINVYYADLDRQGVYVPVGDKQFIVINDTLENEPEGKFVMAHELFHAIEHKELISLYHHGYMVKGKKEREANQFATYLCLIGQTIYEGMTKEDICKMCYIPLEMAKFI